MRQGEVAICELFASFAEIGNGYRRLPSALSCFQSRRLPSAFRCRRLPSGISSRRLPSALSYFQSRRLPNALCWRRFTSVCSSRRLPIGLFRPRRLPSDHNRRRSIPSCLKTNSLLGWTRLIVSFSLDNTFQCFTLYFLFGGDIPFLLRCSSL